MFWRFGGYASISTIDTLLDKPEVTLEEVLDETDLLQELKQHNSKLIEYLREDAILKRLLDYVIAPPLLTEEDAFDPNEDEEDEDDSEDEDERNEEEAEKRAAKREAKAKAKQEREEREQLEKTRQKYAFVASEILASETWSIIEALFDDGSGGGGGSENLRNFWEFLRRDPALDPVTAGYFTKINDTLLDKKTEETLAFFKSLEGIVPAMLQHVDCPMVMDLLLKIISMEKAEGGQGIVDWLYAQDLMPLLLGYLGEEHPTFTQTSAGDFIKAIITISANASQNEQSCIGPNSLTRQLVSGKCIEGLITDMLKGGNPLTVGVGIIIEVIRKNNSDYDPEVQTNSEVPPTTSDPIYLGTLLRLFASHVSDFTDLILSPNTTVLKGGEGADTGAAVKEQRKKLAVAFGAEIEPLGFDRFKTCELMAELLHCSNMSLLNERGSEAFIKQRDIERERLRNQGQLLARGQMQQEENNAMFKGEDPSANQERSKLGIANTSAEDDGFEDVGASADITDEIKQQAGSPVKRSLSRVSLDDEFYDEPLESPKKKKDQKAGPGDQEPSVETREVSATDEDASSSSAGGVNTPQSSGTEDLVSEIEAQLTPSSGASEGGGGGSGNAAAPEQQDASPITGDFKPAPLFSKKSDGSAPQEQGQEGAAATDQQGEGAEEQQGYYHVIENDVDGRPIVGDYLKMQFVEHKVVPTILDFFFRFPWNNFLHNVVYDVVQQVFNGPMDRGYNRNLAFDLFLGGRITDRIVEGQKASDEAQARQNMRLGYMGHLTLVAEEVVKFAERYSAAEPHQQSLLPDSVLEKVADPQWLAYVEHTLTETRERDNAILGGVRPESFSGVGGLGGIGGGPGLGGGGLNGGGLDSMDLSGGSASVGGGVVATGATGGSFLSGGSLLSGFGSSSDEEDEDMDELAEPEEGEAGSGGGGAGSGGSEKSKEVTPLSLFNNKDNAAASSSEGSGSANPIPPPLNIPPSRARLQLAARLAKHKSPDGSHPQGATSDTSFDSAFAAIGAGAVTSPSKEDPWAVSGGGGSGGEGQAGQQQPAKLQSAWEPKKKGDAAGKGGSGWHDVKKGESSEEESSEEGEAEEDDDEGWGEFESGEESEEVPIRLSDSPPKTKRRSADMKAARLRAGSKGEGSKGGEGK